MDQYGQIGPEKGDYVADVKAIADVLLHRGRAVTVALTHRMTRQQIVVALKDSMELTTPPSGTKGGTWVFLAVVEKGAYWFRLDHSIDGGYLASKLGVHRVDGETIADFLGRLASALAIKPVQASSVVTPIIPKEVA